MGAAMPKTDTNKSDSQSTLSKATAELKDDLTLLWAKLEGWQQDNYYIHSGYRSPSSSYRKSISSLTYLHNESVNIYTHLLGSLAFLVASIALYFFLAPRHATTASKTDVRVFACFFAGAVTCLGMSAAFHLFSNHSRAVQQLGNKLDYLGIVFLIWGSFIPSIYYGFGCHPALITRYWTMITTLGAACAVMSTQDRFRTPEWRPFRAGMFAAMGLSAVVPVLHGLVLYGWDAMTELIGLRWLIAHGLMYLTGAALYAARVPERLAPGKFDIWGSSHQIFHVLVLMAAATHLVGLIKAFDYRHSSGILATCLNEKVS